jgi:hypothetical protein
MASSAQEHLDELARKRDWAIDELARAINREFRIGTQVRIEWGRGYCYGVVAFKTSDDCVCIRFDSGRIHHKHYSVVAKVK